MPLYICVSSELKTFESLWKSWSVPVNSQLIFKRFRTRSFLLPKRLAMAVHQRWALFLGGNDFHEIAHSSCVIHWAVHFEIDFKHWTDPLAQVETDFTLFCIEGESGFFLFAFFFLTLLTRTTLVIFLGIFEPNKTKETWLQPQFLTPIEKFLETLKSVGVTWQKFVDQSERFQPEKISPQILPTNWN